MSDATPPARPNSADVRRAAQDFKEAIDAHLLAVETRFGQDDPAIDSTYEHIRHLGHIYDELMIQVHGEGTPFGDDFLDGDDLDDGEAFQPGADMPDSSGDLLSIYVRRDYQLSDPDLLVNRGREAHEMVIAENADYPEEEPVDAASSLYAMYNFAGVDGIDLIGEEAGLLPLGAVVWFMKADQPVGFELDRPFHDIEARADDHLVFKVLERNGDEDYGDDAGGLPGGAQPDAGFGGFALPGGAMPGFPTFTLPPQQGNTGRRDLPPYDD